MKIARILSRVLRSPDCVGKNGVSNHKTFYCPLERMKFWRQRITFIFYYYISDSLSKALIEKLYPKPASGCTEEREQ
jgi:hypothetical protein